MTKSSDKLPSKSAQSEVEAFLRKVAATPPVKSTTERGRLIFAMDATASREPSWDRACHIQSQMFLETDSLGGLDIQLVHYRGFGEFYASPWMCTSEELLARMNRVRCVGGITQIGRVLEHTLHEHKTKKVDALVFVGDCMEEDVDKLSHAGGQLGLVGVPAFIFQEGHEPIAQRAFRQIAKLTKGAYCPFDASSAQQLKDLLSAVAVYAAGGRRALEDFGKRRGGVVLQLTQQVRKA